MRNSVAPFEPDPSFAAGWFVDEPVAQGALKYASIAVLDLIAGAREAAEESELDELGPLVIFPATVRGILTPRLIDRIELATIIVGWKLAQPGTPIPPGCIVEELALELIRQAAVASLSLIDAPVTAVDATKGVYEVCVNGDILDFFESRAPADLALGARYPAADQVGETDVRLAAWFKPFFRGQIGCGIHPCLLELTSDATSAEAVLSPVQPEPPFTIDRDDEGQFRVSVRTWDDDFLGADDCDLMPDAWLYRVQSTDAERALRKALERFPEGADQHPTFDEVEGVRLDRSDVARISIDIQRVGLDQEIKPDSSFHLIGDFSADLAAELLPKLAGHLVEIFPVALLAVDETSSFFGVTVNAESHEEAEADFEDAVLAFCSVAGLADSPISGFSSGQGTRSAAELWREIETYRRR
jgi:hypothetical protein